MLFHFREKQLKLLNTRGVVLQHKVYKKNVLYNNLGCIIMVNLGEPCRVVGCRLQSLRPGKKELYHKLPFLWEYQFFVINVIVAKIFM